MSKIKESKSQLLARIPKSLKDEYMVLCDAMGVSMSSDITNTIRGRIKAMREELNETSGKGKIKEIDEYLKQ